MKELSAKYIFLTGFMGAGKSTTGKVLANLLGCRFVDLDSEIEKKEGRTINELFALKGEQYFRDCETDLLNNLDNSKATVFATGGGIVLREQNRTQMRKTGLIIYLNATWSSLKKRLESSKDRPLVNPGKNWEDVKQRWESRQVCYRDADYIVETDHLNSSQVAESIKNLLEVDKRA